MKDEAFHLTPLDIRRFDFGSALRGYDKSRVDEFRDQVAAEVEHLLKQCQDLEGKAKGFHDREAQLIIREAKAEGEKIVEQARSEVRSINSEMETLVRTRRAFLVQLRMTLQRQLSEVDAAEGSSFPSMNAQGDSQDQAPWVDDLVKK
jgi:DivIVA domain-containing protein